MAAFFFYGALNSGHNTLRILKGDESDVVGALSFLITVILMAAGAYYYWGNKHHRAYDLFEAGLLIEIFVGSVILFFKGPEVAIIGLFVTLVLLASLKLINVEEVHKRVRTKKMPVVRNL